MQRRGLIGCKLQINIDKIFGGQRVLPRGGHCKKMFIDEVEQIINLEKRSHDNVVVMIGGDFNTVLTSDGILLGI